MTKLAIAEQLMEKESVPCLLSRCKCTEWSYAQPFVFTRLEWYSSDGQEKRGKRRRDDNRARTAQWRQGGRLGRIGLSYHSAIGPPNRWQLTGLLFRSQLKGIAVWQSLISTSLLGLHGTMTQRVSTLAKAVLLALSQTIQIRLGTDDTNNRNTNMHFDAKLTPKFFSLSLFL